MRISFREFSNRWVPHEETACSLPETATFHPSLWAIQSLCRGPSEGNSALGRPRRTWDDNFKMDLEEIGWEGAERIHLAQHGDQ
jgi:hypothetical protein